MDHRPFLAQGQAGGHGEDQAYHLDDQRPFAKVPSYDETTQDGLDLRNTWGHITISPMNNLITLSTNTKVPRYQRIAGGRGVIEATHLVSF